MTNTGDLNIEDEILPLFDFTFNYYSGQAVRELIMVPLSSKSEIIYRQNVLKGYGANREVVKDYSFSRFNLSEIYDFFETFSVGSFFGPQLRWKLTFNEKLRHQKRGRLILLIHLFYKIQTAFLNKIDFHSFPKEYAVELERLNGFFIDFDLEHYETILRKKKLRIRHIVELMKIITEKVTNGQAASFWKRWFQFEAFLSISNGIVRNEFVFPSFDETAFSMEGLFHPLIKKPVRNDLFAHKNVILLTGPNMSGKSTLLKSISLCVYLGQTGLAVPASKVIMPLFTTISAAINLTDSIVSGYSHFMTEIITLKKVVEEAEKGSKCFAVFDELFRGTNIEDALEISTVTIKGLTKFTNSIFIISTHLHQLKDLEEIKNNKVATYYIECELNGNTPAFTYKLKEGWSDLKLGRILFEREGLNNMLS